MWGQGRKGSTKHLDAIVLKKWFWKEIMGNFGEILLIGAVKKIHICVCLFFTDLFGQVNFCLELGKNCTNQSRMSDHNERELRKELFEDQSYSI